MRLVEWNCSQGLISKGKWDALRAFSADIYVIAECSETDASTAAASAGLELSWSTRPRAGGDRPTRKGLAVLTKERHDLAPQFQPSLQVNTAVEVRSHGAEPLNLLAIWTREIAGNAQHTTRVHAILDHYAEWLAWRPSIVIGDFNSNSIWDKQTGLTHSQAVGRLTDLGLSSAYHLAHSEAQGAESHATFYFWRQQARAFHIDYCFLPETWARSARVEIGAFDDWIHLSDHVPMVVDFTPAG